VFRKTKDGAHYESIGETSHLLFGLAGLKTLEHWNTEPQEYSIFDLKATVNSFLKALDLRNYISTSVDDNNHLTYYIDDTLIGELFAVDQSLRQAFEIEVPAFAAEFSISAIYRIKQELPVPSYEPVSKFPAFEFDFAVIVDSAIRAETLLQQIKQTAGKKLNNIHVFDVFEGKTVGDHKKSIAFRLSFLDKNKTLTINDVEPIIKKVLKILDNKYSAKLRS
jgi:phenylalanyl-tRNA synthetase beta chain